MLTAVSIDRRDGSRPLRIALPLREEHHDAAFGRRAIRNSTVSNWTPIFGHVLLRGGGHALVTKLVEWPVEVPRCAGGGPAGAAGAAKKRKRTATKTKRSAESWTAKLRCTHSYCGPFRGAKIVKCTFCGTA